MNKFVNRDYQERCLGATVRAHAAGLRSGLNVIATGGGKTVIFGQLRERLEDHGLIPRDSRVLVLAHRDELIQQAKRKILRADPGASIGIEMGDQHASKEDQYVLASVQTVGRAGSKRLLKLDPKSIQLVITDEAHHAAARSYLRIYDHFTHALHDGFTATGFRSDKKSLASVYEDVIFQKPLRELINEGWLARVRGFRRETGTDLSNVRVRRGEYVAEELENAVDNPARNELIVHSHFEHGEGERSLVFCAGRSHAKNVTALFRHYGVEADYIDGETDKQTRKQILRDYSEGKTRVLVNVMVLTEGFDEPMVKNVIMARPTRSALVYAQQLGRVTRIPEEEDVGPIVRERFKTANVIDIADAGRTVQNMNLMRTLGVERDMDLEGRDAVEASEMIEEINLRGHDFESVEELEKLTEDKAYFDIPIVDKMVKKHSPYNWQEMADGSYFLPLPDKNSAHLFEDVMGRVVLRCKFGGKSVRAIMDGKKPRKLSQALKRADAFLRKNAPKVKTKVKNRTTGEYEDREVSSMEKVEWVWLDKRWGRVPATRAQLGALEKFRVKHKQPLTKGEASLLLSRVIAVRVADKIRKV